ncbi:PhoX family phosphatase [Aquincola sp. S2]|uniref:PhoX family phosphatase n=1 Tax=Pseudaquabacterium terrae TaxID=2732868 RepID=A0ABX2EP51_9BURK|nr:PhoX family phosphatase [Aquabacterium terrae]NRF70426.1 PhoX family phosphatase [Aquabacterium terrae]
MAKDFETMEDSNRSSNPSIHDLSDPARRRVLQGGLGLLSGGLLASLGGCASPGSEGGPLLGFKSVPLSSADAIQVPEGYASQVLMPWGEPVGIAGAMPAFKPDASNSGAEQELQMGMHHDGLHYYALDGARRGLLVMNHEYVDNGLLFADGEKTWNADKVRKAQAAHGVSVTEITQQADGQWQAVRPSRHARRFTAATPMAVQGPAAGHALMKTAADPAGRRVLGTLNNCASGKTPWGTYLTGEENWAYYFALDGDPDNAHHKRWGLRKGKGTRWHEHDERFDAGKHPNEPNRFGWIVEIDPFDPASTPVKRTAVGRAAHEGATVALTKDGRAVVYSGEDARFEYLYKFVSKERMKPGGGAANATLLDEGVLHVARFDADGRGRWLPLVHGQGPLTAANGFADQGEVVIKARQASDALGATKLDRPEWVALDQNTREVYCALTNNSRRGGDKDPGTDAANPRANNTMGHVLRWKEAGDFDGETFEWTHFVLAGDPANERAEAKGNVRGDIFGCPDGLWVDARGVLWIGTDMSSSVMGKGEFARLGNNMLLAADPRSGEVRRFLTGPVGCEITGSTMTPDGRTLFINIQHPGETPSEISDPANPMRFSRWPDGVGRPRSATVVIRKRDGGVIGT